MGTKTIIMLCLVGYRIYSNRNKPIKPVNFTKFLQKGGKLNEISANK